MSNKVHHFFLSGRSNYTNSCCKDNHLKVEVKRHTRSVCSLSKHSQSVLSGLEKVDVCHTKFNRLQQE